MHDNVGVSFGGGGGDVRVYPLGTRYGGTAARRQITRRCSGSAFWLTARVRSGSSSCDKFIF